ncbi:MAG TPA: DNA methyltransferase, partial [Candidatus Sulfotelmatobacter sp.]
FLGSGTTLAAAELTGRVCYGIELDAKYVDVVIQRWQALSGKQATLDGDSRTFEEIARERRKVIGAKEFKERSQELKKGRLKRQEPVERAA